MDRPSINLVASQLQVGDIIFSTTQSLDSRVIRRLTTSRFSHVSIYFGQGVVVEANDKGAGPTKLAIRGSLNTPAGSELCGLPYPNWTALAVLRKPGVDPKAEASIITSLIKEDLGRDFPSLSGLARRTGHTFIVPFALALDVGSWLTNRHPLLPGCWCSQLVAKVVLDRADPAVRSELESKLQRPSPQDLYDLCISLGYRPVPSCVTTAQLESPGDAARTAYDIARNETFDKLMVVALTQRGHEMQNFFARNARLLVRLLVLLLFVGVGAVAFQQCSSTPSAPAPPILSPVTMPPGMTMPENGRNLKYVAFPLTSNRKLNQSYYSYVLADPSIVGVDVSSPGQYNVDWPSLTTDCIEPQFDHADFKDFLVQVGSRLRYLSLGYLPSLALNLAPCRLNNLQIYGAEFCKEVTGYAAVQQWTMLEVFNAPCGRLTRLELLAMLQNCGCIRRITLRGIDRLSGRLDASGGIVEGVPALLDREICSRLAGLADLEYVDLGYNSLSLYELSALAKAPATEVLFEGAVPVTGDQVLTCFWAPSFLERATLLVLPAFHRATTSCLEATTKARPRLTIR